MCAGPDRGQGDDAQVRPLLQEWRYIRYNTLPYVHGGATRSHGGGMGGFPGAAAIAGDDDDGKSKSSLFQGTRA